MKIMELLPYHESKDPLRASERRRNINKWGSFHPGGKKKNKKNIFTRGSKCLNYSLVVKSWLAGKAGEFKSGATRGLTLYGTANYSAIIVSNAVTHLSSACSAFAPAINPAVPSITGALN